MIKRTQSSISRRDFVKKTLAGLAGLSAPGLVKLRGQGPEQARAQESPRPTESIEPNPVVRVLRWKAFVPSESGIWLANTRRWEHLTGGRVIINFLSWEDVRPRAAMEAILGTGHDLVLSWYDDPHLYPDCLLDLSDLAEYLGGKYGGWYPICETYGRSRTTNCWIALPMGCAGLCINFRKGWVQEAGFETMPGDIEGFIKCCQALKAKGHPTGFALGHGAGDPNSWTHWWLWAFGGKAVEPDGKTVAINSKETIMSLDAARELYETMIPGVEKWLDPDNNQAFLAGDISVTNNGTSILYAAKYSKPAVEADLGTINYPIGPVGRPTELSLMSQAFIFKHSPVPRAAKHYLRYMLEAEQYGTWISGSLGYITQNLRSFYDLPDWEKDSRITPYRDCIMRMLPNGYAGPLGKASAAAMSDNVIVDMIADVCLGKKTPQASALHAEKKLVRLYS